MKLLHTSDWHIGKILYSKKERQSEYELFFAWLLKTINENSIDLLLVAGDIFDTSSPNSASQKMYYDFLLKVVNSGCQNVVIIGGNHDSPSFLNAPKDILAVLNVYVIGNATENIEDEIILIRDNKNKIIAIICAVPFLRERDISRFIEGETYTDRSKRIAENIKKHYEIVTEFAENLQKGIQKKIPVIATGHLSVAGGKKVEDDGVRDIYIGNIECVGREIFSPIFDYVALGHYHIASVIDKHIRYSGSPVPMGFGEANQKKSVTLVDFSEVTPITTTLEVPVFQKMESIRGDKSYISNRIEELKKSGSSIWVEIIYDGDDVFPELTTRVTELTANTKIEIIKLQNKQYQNEVLTQNENKLSLDDLDKFEVFDILLEKNNISTEKKEELKTLYHEITFLVEN